MKPRTILFAGGGTGGHLFPAIAIYEQLRRFSRGPLRALYLCSTRPLDAKILRGESVDFEAIPAQPFGLRPRPLLRFLSSWGESVRSCRAAIRRCRAESDSVHVLAMGGFVAAPAAQAARVERCPLWLVNLDAVPGKANRWIARRASRTFTAAPVGIAAAASWTGIRPIVREAAVAFEGAAACRQALCLDPKRPTLFVTGASQGARSINDLLALLVREHGPALQGWQIIHQSGNVDPVPLETTYHEAGVPALVRDSFREMCLVWGAADLALSRAGAGSVAEAWANRVPTLFLPYPHHRDQHQRRNALVLEQAGAAAIHTDRVDPRANLGDAGKALLALLADAPKRDRMRQALRSLGPCDGAETVARALLEAARPPP